LQGLPLRHQLARFPHALLVVLGGLGLGARTWYPEIASAHGPGMQRMLDFTLLASAAFFVLGHLALIYLLVRAFRHPGKAGEHPRRPWLVALIPSVLMALVAEGGVIVLGLPVFGQYYGAAPPNASRTAPAAARTSDSTTPIIST